MFVVLFTAFASQTTSEAVRPIENYFTQIKFKRINLTYEVLPCTIYQKTEHDKESCNEVGSVDILTVYFSDRDFKEALLSNCVIELILLHRNDNKHLFAKLLAFASTFAPTYNRVKRKCYF